MKLPKLYKQGKAGEVRVLEITVDGPNVITAYGVLDGKLTQRIDTATPKSVGKSNETTAEQQAILEAKAKHTLKIKEGYSTSIDTANTVELPMKVKVYQKQLNNIIFPCISTPKYNGVNALVRLENDQIVIYSRGGNVYPSIPHLEDQLRSAMNFLGSTSLNGELYIHGYHLQDITSAVKKPNPDSSKLKFMLFDIADSKDIYKLRRSKLEDLNHHCQSRLLNLPDIIPVLGSTCNTHDDIERIYNLHMSLGYEGSVIKNLHGLYEYSTRSSHQFKYKKAQDAEFKIVDYQLDKYKHPVYICESNNNTFKVKRKGTAAERLADADVAQQNIGKWLTVEFETYSKDLIPLKPVGLTFRDCDSDGNPLI